MLLKQPVFVLKKSPRKTSYMRRASLSRRIFRSRKDHQSSNNVSKNQKSLSFHNLRGNRPVS
jgi:hypothetical protein